MRRRIFILSLCLLGEAAFLGYRFYPALLRKISSWNPAAASVEAKFEKARSLFLKYPQGRPPEIWAASEDWFLEPWGRDTFISMPGLLFFSGHFNEAKAIFRSFAAAQKNGLIPNRILSGVAEYNTADGSLWFIQTFKKYMDYTGDRSFSAEMLPVIRAVLVGYEKGTGYFRGNRFHEIKMDPSDALVISPAQSTWMDADPDGRHPVTPRNGKAVEINALWYSGVRFFVELLEKNHGEETEILHYRNLAERVKASFNRKFWNEHKNILWDVIEGDPQGESIRPNMIFAVSHGGDLLAPKRQKAVLGAVESDLLTPYGLRTLSPHDPDYHGRYHTELPMSEKDQAYHQGTVWPWLMGAYVDAWVLVSRSEGMPEKEIKESVWKTLKPLVEFLSQNGSLPELFDGDLPQKPGGTHSQAWSVAEVYRALQEHGRLN